MLSKTFLPGIIAESFTLSSQAPAQGVLLGKLTVMCKTKTDHLLPSPGSALSGHSEESHKGQLCQEEETRVPTRARAQVSLWPLTLTPPSSSACVYWGAEACFLLSVAKSVGTEAL